MGSLTVETTRYVDFYQVQDQYGNYYKQSHILSVVDSSGKLTDAIVKESDLTAAQKSAMVANGIKFDNYGNAYFETENLSRFLHYGVDSNGTLYVFNYAGEKLRVDSDGTLEPPTPGDTFAYGEKDSFLSQINATYDLNWNNVTMNGLSLSRVIMLVTIIRAELIEQQLVEQMEDLAARTAKLHSSATAEQYILDNYNNTINSSTTIAGLYTYPDGSQVTNLQTFLQNVLGINVSFSGNWSQEKKDEVISAIQSKQDELNTISQETSINIQSLINKRDQAYLLGSNAISLFNSGHMNVARNV